MRKTVYESHLVLDNVLYVRNRSLGKHIGDERPAMLGIEVFCLRKKGFVRVEGTIEIIILVPFVMKVVYFVVRRRSCKV